MKNFCTQFTSLKKLESKCEMYKVLEMYKNSTESKSRGRRFEVLTSFFKVRKPFNKDKIRCSLQLIFRQSSIFSDLHCRAKKDSNRRHSIDNQELRYQEHLDKFQVLVRILRFHPRRRPRRHDKLYRRHLCFQTYYKQIAFIEWVI